MNADEAIEIINNAQQYSEEEYNFVVHQIKEWKGHSDELRKIKDIDEAIFEKADMADEVELLTWKLGDSDFAEEDDLLKYAQDIREFVNKVYSMGSE